MPTWTLPGMHYEQGEGTLHSGNFLRLFGQTFSSVGVLSSVYQVFCFLYNISPSEVTLASYQTYLYSSLQNTYSFLLFYSS